MVGLRLSRFNRSSNISPIRLTERDLSILRHVHRHRFLRSNHITSLLNSSRQQTLRRLQLLYHHGFLDRPRCQIDYYHRSGSQPIAYGLGYKGAGFLKRKLALPYHRLEWPHKRPVERFFLEHTLLVADFMVALEIACQNRSDLRLLSEDDIDHLANPNAKCRPCQWRVNIGKGLMCGVIPDRVFGVEFVTRPKGKNRVWFCLEADRGTMPVKRGNLDQSSFYRKLLAYEATWAQSIHRARFGWTRFRVITVTSSSERLASIRKACRAMKHGQGLFLFADVNALQMHSDFLRFPWQTSRDGETALLIE